jgi:hypothetical protein
MSAAFESEHSRAASGKFASQQSRLPEIAFDFYERTADGDRPLSDFADGADITILTPKSAQELYDALHTSPLPNAVMRVRIEHPMTQLTETRVTGPATGRPLLIDIVAGPGLLRIVSGYVVVRVDSPDAADILVEGDAEVTAIVARGRTVVITAEGRSSIFVFAESGARGAIQVRDAGVTADVAGDTTRFHIANTFLWDI